MSAPPSSDRQENTKISVKYHGGSAQYFTEQLSNRVSLQMMLILGGEFTMGAPETELDSNDSERPQHKVTVPTFFMGKYPVTQEQWQAIMENNPSRFKGNRRPVESLSWNDAKEFCQKLSDKTKRQYRLPTEAQWEYACRAVASLLFKEGQGGSYPPFHFGKTITTDLANYNGNYTYGEGIKGEYREETTLVDKFGIANNFGLCDMHGNVWEWCEDDWYSNYDQAPTDGSAWLSKTSNRKVLRGGSWNVNPNLCRSASRYGSPPEDTDDFVGFRVVCEVSSVIS